MTPRVFSTVEDSSSESPRAPSLIDSDEEAKQEAETLRRWNEEQKRRRETGSQEPTTGQEPAEQATTTTSAAPLAPVEETLVETPNPPRKFIIPKKSAHTPMEVGKKESTGDKMEPLRDVPGPSRTFKDEMLPAEVGPVVRPKTRKDARVTFVG